MSKNVGMVAGLFLGLAVAFGVAHSSRYAVADTAVLDDVVVDTVSDSLTDVAVLKPNKDGTSRGTCSGGTSPRCFRDECPSTTECPAKDQCYGKLTCARYDTVVGTGKTDCRMLGDCSPPSGQTIVIY